MRRTPSATIHQQRLGVKPRPAHERASPLPSGVQCLFMDETTVTTRSSPLRILMVAPTSFFADYGCHVRILEEVRALTGRGHAVRVCTYHNGNDVPGVDIRRSVDVPWLKRAEVGSSRHKAYLDVALFLETLRQAVRFRPDVIHGHLHEGALIGSVVGRLLRVPVVFDYQGSLTAEMLDHGFIRQRGKREAFFRFLERRIDRLPARVVPSGVAAHQHLLETGVPADRIRLLHDGVNLRQFDPDQHIASRVAVRNRLGIPLDAPVVVYLGLLADYQGIPDLIRALRLLVDGRPDLYALVAGYPGAERYAQQAADLPQVLFPGRVPYEHAPALLAAGDVAVAPKRSSTESNGKLFNYMAMRLPIVAINLPGNLAILGELGHLVEPDNPVALADALDVAFRDSASERAALRQRVIEHFSWDDRVRDLEAIYREVLEPHKRRLGAAKPS
jgi:glycosyltransferase involved in cell wall biosynthesis